MNGPRLYNSLSPEEQEARLRRRQEKKKKEIHQARKTRIISIFAIIFVFLGIQTGVKISQVHRLNGQVQSSKAELSKVEHKKNALTNERDNLKDSNYIAKLIRSKFFYSKTNEKVYNLKGK